MSSQIAKFTKDEPFIRRVLEGLDNENFAEPRRSVLKLKISEVLNNFNQKEFVYFDRCKTKSTLKPRNKFHLGRWRVFLYDFQAAYFLQILSQAK